LSLHPAALPDEELLALCRRENTRGSGPGGQHRNRVATAVRLTHTASGLMGQASERRSQKENAVKALFRLRLNLALDYRSPLKDEDFAIPYQAGPWWTSRLRGQKIRINPEHRDFPSALAEVLDLLAFHHDDLPKTAEWLGVSTSQLIKFLATEPRALGSLNQRLQSAGRRTYRA
jgi:hypothetical protein